MYTVYILQYAICCIFVPSIMMACTQQLCDISSTFIPKTGMKVAFDIAPLQTVSPKLADNMILIT
jgi:hypothetical protein